MLRIVVLVLLLANLVYFAWTQGHFQTYGFAPVVPREPQRLQQQLKPESIRLLSEAELEKALALAAQPAKECVQAGPFNDKQVAAVRKSMETAFPEGGWELAAVSAPANWVVYMGKYASEELVWKKQGELKALGVKTEIASTPELQPGLILGVWESEAAAKAELARLAAQGIRTARVVKEREAGQVHFLKVPEATEPVKAKLTEMKAALAGQSLKPCN